MNAVVASFVRARAYCGAHERFGQSLAKISDLSLLAIPHVHPDHVADLPAVLWLSNRFRKESLPVVGPSGNDVAPDISTFLSRLFNAKTGAFQVMGSALGSKRAYAASDVCLDINVVDLRKKKPRIVFVCSSDQAGTDLEFAKFANGADVLIMHLTIGEGEEIRFTLRPMLSAVSPRRQTPKRLIVSHFGPMDLNRAVAELKKFYTGPLTIGADLQCTQVQ